MPIVAMPDNTQVQFPDDMPESEIRGLIAQKFPDAVKAAAPPSGGGKTMAFASGANDALLGIPQVLAAGARSLFGRKSFKENYQDIESEYAGASAENPGTSLLGLGAGALVTAPLAAAATPFKAALALQKGQKVANVGRLAAQGAGAGAVFGATAGAIEGAAEGLPEGDVTRIATTAAREGALGGAFGAAGGLAASAVGAGVGAARRAINRNTVSAIPQSVRLLAKQLDEDPVQLAQTMREYRAATGRGLSIAEILSAKSIANTSPYVNAKQSSRVILQEGADAAREALPSRVSEEAAASGAATKTPFIAEPALRTAKQAPLEQLRDEQMDAAMAPLRGQQVTLTTAEKDILEDPLLRAAFSKHANPKLAEKVAAAATDLGDPNNMAHQGMTVEDLDSLRKYLGNQRDSAYRESQGQLAQQFDGLANRVQTIVSSQHPEYGVALDDFARQSQFINAFEHAYAGKAADDASGALARATFGSEEGRLGLELGARSRVVDKAASSESAAQRIADMLRQGGDTPTAQQLTADQLADMARVGKIESQAQQNLSVLSGGRLPSVAEEETKKLVGGLETAVAIGGHTTTGFGVHALTRALTGLRVSKATANDLAQKLLKTDPADVDAITDLLKRADISADKQRKVLALIARHGGALAAQTRPDVGE